MFAKHHTIDHYYCFLINTFESFLREFLCSHEKEFPNLLNFFTIRTDHFYQVQFWIILFYFLINSNWVLTWNQVNESPHGRLVTPRTRSQGISLGNSCFVFLSESTGKSLTVLNRYLDLCQEACHRSLSLKLDKIMKLSHLFGSAF